MNVRSGRISELVARHVLVLVMRAACVLPATAMRPQAGKGSDKGK